MKAHALPINECVSESQIIKILYLIAMLFWFSFTYIIQRCPLRRHN